MASKQKIVTDLLNEFGKSSPQARAEIEQKVADVTLDLLSQNEGRFKALETSVLIPVTTGEKAYLLPSDFNTPKQTFAEVKADGEFVAECAIIAKNMVQRRLAEGSYAGHRLCYIVDTKEGADGPGRYLMLASQPDSDTYFELDYYRQPTTDDTDLIRNEDILKTGVRGRLSFNDKKDYDLAIYLKMRDGFRESPGHSITDAAMLPGRRIGQHNVRMHRIGEGR